MTARHTELSIPEVQMNDYKITFNASNLATNDFKHKLPTFATFQTVDEQQ